MNLFPTASTVLSPTPATLVVPSGLIPDPQTALQIAGQIADAAAARQVFAAYRERRASQTLRRQDGDLELFATYLAAAQIPPPVLDGGQLTWGALLAHDPHAWIGVTWGLVAGFVQWMVGAGYAVESINVRLSTVKMYAKLAAQAGAITGADYDLIRGVTGYGYSEGINLDQRRVQTRIGHKKAEAVFLNKVQVLQLKRQSDTPAGRMRALMLAIFLDHGLRLGELLLLQTESFSLADGMLTFWRPKVKKRQTHELTTDALGAAYAYIGRDVPATGPLWFKSAAGAALGAAQLGERDVRRLIQQLGQQLPATLTVPNLSPHDLRHTWATLAARSGTSVDALQEAGGWTSPSMPLRYIAAAVIANQGVRLG